ncbi:alpha/beta hydrolase [uncultured Propionibacterium sp.]|uniref:alpha/beta hydrolase n=1 Tax=uncultured Propionibacterium sp. TaxID=218066 RepID=UPI0037DBF95D
MPDAGTTGYVTIPSTVSGFDARSAGVYLPPAALVEDAPKLPVIIMMMGQPGNPDPTSVAAILDAYAAAHEGIAPIVVLADQLGDPDNDTLCMDTSYYGGVETYVTTDVVNWIGDNLNVSADRDDWTVAGYSNGGLCSILFGAKHPDLFGTILDISGELYQGEEHPEWNLENVFGGDQAAYDAVKPLTILGENHYEDMWAYFSYGTEDGTFGPDAVAVSQAAQDAGMTVLLDPLQGADHFEAAIQGGFTNGLAYWSRREGLD